MSWVSAWFACGLLQAASAAAPRSRVSILTAFRITEARCRIHFCTRQHAVVELERLIFCPALAFAGECEIAADRICVAANVGRRHGTRLVEVKVIGGDDE